MTKITTHTIRNKKNAGEKITMITAYDYPTAKIVDESGIDIILVGDSVGNVVLGYDSTVKVTMEDMVHHTKAVARGAKNALVVADMPFLSYHTGKNEAIKNAGRLMQEANADCVKLEGGGALCEIVSAMVRAGIPVMGHLGLTPQSVNVFGGFFVQGKTESQQEQILQDAIALEQAGVFALVLECVPAALAKKITQQLSIPVIGIGAGADCDGQVLVFHDMIGLTMGKLPKFVKQFCNAGAMFQEAVAQYVQDVKNGTFPEEKHTY
jgi:3-methyl-2-oxobutanoate hydroxymethyltransferase